MRETELFEDGYSGFGTMLVFKWEPDSGKVYHVDFEIHEVISDPPMYEIFGWEQSGDWTEKLEEACPQVSGTVKWDACSHVYFGNREKPEAEPDGYLHLCGYTKWAALSASMARAFERCSEIMKQAKTWLE